MPLTLRPGRQWFLNISTAARQALRHPLHDCLQNDDLGRKVPEQGALGYPHTRCNRSCRYLTRVLLGRLAKHCLDGDGPRLVSGEILCTVAHHESWAAPIVFALAFAESLAFLSLVLPSWAALVGIGAMIRAGGIDFVPLWISGALGVLLKLGDVGTTISSWLWNHVTS